MTVRRPSPTELAAARASTRSVYQAQAQAFDRQRVRTLREKAWLDRFLEDVPVNGQVLDLGCGTGEPITGYLLGQGRRVTGIDYSRAMLEIARRRHPRATFLEQDMTVLDVAGPFRGAISWDGSFHLTAREQADLVASLGSVLAAGSPLLLTIGSDAGEVIGHVNGHAVYHASLSPDDYRRLLERNGFTDIDIVREDAVCDRSLLHARKQLPEPNSVC